jgi:hypothetical protein
MLSRNLFLILSIVFLALGLYIACANFTTPFALLGFGTPMPLPAGAAMLLEFGCALLSVLGLWAIQKRREAKGEQELVKWSNQDAKLMTEIASDQVKLLEAKIATLEVALKSALKKKN